MKIEIDHSELINDIVKREIEENVMCFLISIYDLVQFFSFF
jgi:hypothetical protein